MPTPMETVQLLGIARDFLPDGFRQVLNLLEIRLPLLTG